MDIYYSSFVSSAPLHIKGPSGKSFFAHSALIAKHSKVLDKAINGHMKEAEEKKIDITDIDGDLDDETIIRFIQYAYTGAYTVHTDCSANQSGSTKSDTNSVLMDEYSSLKTHAASFQKLWSTAPELSALSSLSASRPLSESSLVESTTFTFGRPLVARSPNVAISNGPLSRQSPSPVIIFEGESSSRHTTVNSSRDPWKTPSSRAKGGISPQPVPNSSDSSTTPPASATVQQKKEQLWYDFVSKAEVKKTVPWVPRVALPSENRYTTDLLCHAKVYVFSNRYECEALAPLALQRLRLTLSRFDPCIDLGSAIELLRYTYAHTFGYEDGTDQLRALVIEYTVCHLEKIVKDKRFKELLRQEGDFADDLMSKAMVRLQ